MLILKKDIERNIISLTDMKPLQNLTSLRTVSLPWILRPRETICIPKRVLIWFSGLHLSSSILSVLLLLLLLMTTTVVICNSLKVERVQSVVALQ